MSFSAIPAQTGSSHWDRRNGSLKEQSQCCDVSALGPPAVDGWRWELKWGGMAVYIIQCIFIRLTTYWMLSMYYLLLFSTSDAADFWNWWKMECFHLWWRYKVIAHQNSMHVHRLRVLIERTDNYSCHPLARLQQQEHSTVAGSCLIWYWLNCYSQRSPSLKSGPWVLRTSLRSRRWRK